MDTIWLKNHVFQTLFLLFPSVIGASGNAKLLSTGLFARTIHNVHRFPTYLLVTRTQICRWCLDDVYSVTNGALSLSRLALPSKEFVRKAGSLDATEQHTKNAHLWGISVVINNNIS